MKQTSAAQAPRLREKHSSRLAPTLQSKENATMGHMSDLVKLAHEVAEQAHRGQVDKAGRPYIEHPRRVERHLERLHPDAPQEARAAALLHDVVEDTPVTLAGLRSLGFPEAVLAAVDAVTKREGEPKEAYFARIRADRLAPLVKQADMADNTDPARMALLPKETRARLTAKYARAAELLNQTRV